MKIIERIHNVETNEVTDVERDMTAKELADYQAAQETIASQAASQATNATAKAALLDRLGITEDEAKLLLS